MIEVEGEDLVKLHQERGGHRIQRVPPTERRGRVHTSTVTVAVIDPKSIDKVTFNESDFKIEWYSGTGAGGQHRNKHQNSCRITHLPTKTVSTAQCRSRETSLNEAIRSILNKVNGELRGNVSLDQAVERKNQVGSGERGDKIRTYRFQDDLVKDHRSGRSATCSKVMSGFFDLLWE